MSGAVLGRRALAGALVAAAPAQASLPPNVSVMTWSATSLPAFRESFAHYLRSSGAAVRHVHVPWGRYLEALPDALRRPDGPDMVWVSDSWLPELANAGLLAPLDSIPEIGSSMRDIERGCRQAMEFRGRVYGLPFYRDALVLFYNRDILEEAGFHEPPNRWSDLIIQARLLQARRPTEKPLIMPLANEPWLLEMVTALTYSFGGAFIGPNKEPLMTRDEAGILPALNLLQELLHDLRIVPEEALRFTEAECAQRFGAGRHAFAILPGYRLHWLRQSNNAAAADSIEPALLPIGGRATSPVTCGWVRFQAISRRAMVSEPRASRAVALLNSLGGRDSQGAHSTARRLFLNHALPFCAVPLDDDAEVRERRREWGHAALVLDQVAATARPKDTIAPGAALWQTMTDPLWRRVAAGNITPAQAAAAAEAAWRQVCDQCGPHR